MHHGFHRHNPYYLYGAHPRALLEGWASGMWARYSGVLLWKTANPWAGLRGQLYDWRLAQTGGFYGARRACEPLHVQLNLRTLQVCAVKPLSAALYGSRTEHVWHARSRGLTCNQKIIDTTYEVTAHHCIDFDRISNYSCVQVEVVIVTRLGLEGACAVLQSFVVAPDGQRTSQGDSRRIPLAHAAANAVTPVAGSAVTQAAAGVTFVFLHLHAADGRQLSRNVYWLADPQVMQLSLRLPSMFLPIRTALVGTL